MVCCISFPVGPTLCVPAHRVWDTTSPRTESHKTACPTWNYVTRLSSRCQRSLCGYNLQAPMSTLSRSMISSSAGIVDATRGRRSRESLSCKTNLGSVVFNTAFADRQRIRQVVVSQVGVATDLTRLPAYRDSVESYGSPRI